MKEPLRIEMAVIDAAGTRKQLVSIEDLSQKDVVDTQETISKALVAMGRAKL